MTEVNDINDKITKYAKSLEEEKKMIALAIKNTKIEEICEDRFIDMLARAVFQKIKNFQSRPSHQQKSKSPAPKTKASKTSTFETILSIFVIFSIIGILIYLIIDFFRPASSSKAPDIENIKLGDSDSSKSSASKEKKEKRFPLDKTGITIDNFQFVRASTMAPIDYKGREAKIKEIKNKIVFFTKNLQRKTKLQMDQDQAYLNQNFALYGPPGTGKTAFVNFIMGQVDYELKIAYLRKYDKDFKELEKQNSSESKKKVQEMIRNSPSRVVYCFINSSTIMNSMSGESNKNVSKLFDIANEISVEEPYQCVILFFDEGDQFFSARDGNEHESVTSVKNEFLARLGQMPKTRYYSVFSFCTTNRFSSFDDAFKRRFNTKEEFEVPNYEERVHFVKCLLDKYDIDKQYLNRVLDTIARLTEGQSQDFISSKLKDFLIFDDRTKENIGLKLREYVSYLFRNRIRFN